MWKRIVGKKIMKQKEGQGKHPESRHTQLSKLTRKRREGGLLFRITNKKVGWRGRISGERGSGTNGRGKGGLEENFGKQGRFHGSPRHGVGKEGGGHPNSL